MRTRSVEEQLAAFRPGLGLAAQLHRWLLAGAGLGVVVALLWWNPLPLILTLFLAVVACSGQRAGPNIVAALAAYDTAAPTRGEVGIRISSWSDSDSYHAVVRTPGLPAWQYEFIPQGWRPASGRFPARIWRAQGTGQPLPAIVDGGIMIPRYDPKFVAEEAPDAERD